MRAYLANGARCVRTCPVPNECPAFCNVEGKRLIRKTGVKKEDRPRRPQPPPELPSSIVQVELELSPTLLGFAWSRMEHPDARRIPGFRLEDPAKRR